MSESVTVELELLAHQHQEAEAAWLQESAARIREAHARAAQDATEDAR